MRNERRLVPWSAGDLIGTGLATPSDYSRSPGATWWVSRGARSGTPPGPDHLGPFSATCRNLGRLKMVAERGYT